MHYDNDSAMPSMIGTLSTPSQILTEPNEMHTTPHRIVISKECS